MSKRTIKPSRDERLVEGKSGLSKLTNAPDVGIMFDFDSGSVQIGDGESGADLTKPNSVAMSSLVPETPGWMKSFYQQMDGITKSEMIGIDHDSGNLVIEPELPQSDLAKFVEVLAFVFESQYRQNKEILLWLGELILIHSTQNGLTLEEAIEKLKLTERNNGVTWSMRTLVKWPVVVQRIPESIRRLPIPPSYLAEAALFKQPEDPAQRVQFNNSRDALLLSVAKNPSQWSRNRFCASMKEIQTLMGIPQQRDEGVRILMKRLISFYRIRSSVRESEMKPKFGFVLSDISAWITALEFGLARRGVIPDNPEDEVVAGDGRTEQTRQKNSKRKEEPEKDGEET